MRCGPGAMLGSDSSTARTCAWFVASRGLSRSRRSCCLGCRRRFFFSSRRRHTRSLCDWSSDVCSSDLADFSPEVIRSLVSLLSSASSNAVRRVIASHIRHPNKYLYDFFDQISEDKRVLLLSVAIAPNKYRSEERRVGKECRNRRSHNH